MPVIDTATENITFSREWQCWRTGHVPVRLHTSCVCQDTNTYAADMRTLSIQWACGISHHVGPCTSLSCTTAYNIQVLCSKQHDCMTCCSKVSVVHECQVVGQAVPCQARYSKLRILLQVQTGYQDARVSHCYITSCINILMFGVSLRMAYATNDHWKSGKDVCLHQKAP